MSERKLRQPAPGQPKPALTRLKELGAEERAAVLAILRANTYAEARKKIATQVGFDCPKGALSRFFSWQTKQDAIRQSKDMLGQMERFLQQQRPEFNEEKVREIAGIFFMMQTLQNHDAREFVKVARLGILDKHHQIESRKLDFRLKKLKHLSKTEPQLGDHIFSSALVQKT